MAMTRWMHILVVAVTIGAAAFVWADPTTTTKTGPIFKLPKRTVPAVHEKCPEAKRSCTTCHKNARTSRWSSERLVPRMADCGACHPAATGATFLTEPTPACRRCHETIDKAHMPTASIYRGAKLRFSHKAHTETPCKTCHPKTGAHRRLEGPLDVVGMKQCFSCHAGSSCRTCHITNQDGRMITTINGKKLYPPKWLAGSTHGEGWSGTHARQAGRNSSQCASCHQDRFCRDCHAGTRRPRNIHPGDWLTAHGVSTRLDNPRCKGCHRKQTFCITCHRRSGVAPDSPPDAKPKTGLSRFHQGMETPELMRRAKHDVIACVSCHAESACISCHVRINPHPSGFKRRCRALTRRNRQSCAKCHTNDVSRLCR